MKFSSEIEGLRGVAILLVVLAHAGVPGMAAGFIGVDVFFVISGFLITGLLSQELEVSGTVDYWTFFARRARRLAPALLVMVACVSLVAIACLPRSSLVSQLDSGFWALLWAANIFFSFAQFDYFGASASDILFLHTWSLGVEEQFYLLWPWLLALTWRRLGASSYWLLALVVTGFATSLVLLALDANSAYYLMPSRLWQLAMGGLTYRMLAKLPSSPIWSDGLALIGVGLLAATLMLVDESTQYPGWSAALPTLAAVSLLSASFAGTGWLVRGLSSEWLRLPGRISYSWYLWHWPFLVFLPAWGFGQPTPILTLALMLGSFLVAWASHAFIEAPFRRRQFADAKVVVAVSVLASVTLAALLHLVSSMLSPARDEGAVGSFESRVYSQLSIPEIYADPACDQWYHSAELVPCHIETGSAKAGGTIVLVADSIGAQWIPAVQQVAREQSKELVVLTKSACPIVDEPFVYGRINRRFTECEEWRDKAVEYVRKTQPGLVLIGSTTTYGFTREQWVEGTIRLLDRLSGTGRSIVVIAPTPVLPFDAPRCVVSRGRENLGGLEALDCHAPLSETEAGDVLEDLRVATGRVAGSHLLNLNDRVCPNGQCAAVMDGRLVFRDEKHLNASFVQSLGPVFDQRLRAALDTAGNR